MVARNVDLTADRTNHLWAVALGILFICMYASKVHAKLDYYNSLFLNIHVDVTHRGVNPEGLGGRDPSFWAGGRGGSQGVVKYYYILSCPGSIFESGHL